MAQGPEAALQRAEFAALRASAALIEAFGASGPPRIYDEIPPAPVFPYIRIGQHEVNNDAHCVAAWEVTSTVHVFARPGSARANEPRGHMHTKAIAAVVADVLGALAEIEGFAVVADESDTNFEGARYFYDPDGLTSHGVLTFRYLVDKPSS